MLSDRLRRGLFVTGTDTEVGKTCISAGLLHGLAAAGLRVAGYKPVAAGTEGVGAQRHNDDVDRLLQASSVAVSAQDVCRVLLDTACAPHVAARLEGLTIDRAGLMAGAHALAGRCDAVVVEGVGGFCVPLVLPLPGTSGFDTADLAVEIGLPVVLVVALRLGCLNHALLTAEAIAGRGLRLAGWVGNQAAADMPHRQANVDSLQQLLAVRFGAPCLGLVPHLNDPAARAVAAHLDIAAVRAAIDGVPSVPPRADSVSTSGLQA
jgi:dethiobiotin synthetase